MRRSLFFGTTSFLLCATAIGAGTLAACGSSFDTAAAMGADAASDGPNVTAPGAESDAANPADDAGASDATVTGDDAATDLDAAGSTDADADADADAAAPPIVVAETNGAVTYLAANEQTVGWIEGDTTLRFASATKAGSAATTGITLADVTAFAMSNDYAYVGASGPGSTNLQAYNFTSSTPVASADALSVTDVVALDNQTVWDIGSASQSIEMFTAPLMGGVGGGGNGTGINATQLFAGGTYLYYNTSNTIYVCAATSDCNATKTRLFVVPKGAVLYAANDDVNNANVFYFDTGQLYGCTYKPAASANGFGCTSPVMVAAAANAGGLATNGGYVYWIDLGGSSPGVYRESIRAGLADGGDFGHGIPERIAAGDTSTANLTVNSTSIFWSTATGTTTQTIYRLPQLP